MFIQTEETPNPLVMKFIPERQVLKTGVEEFNSIEDSEKSPLARALFGIDGVSSVFLGTEFVSVTREETFDWILLKTDILCVLVDFFASNQDVSSGVKSGNEILDDDDEIVKQIKILIDEKVRPAVAQDGGDVVFSSFEDGILYLEMRGACSGCPSAGATLQVGIGNMMRHYIPEVIEIRQA